IVASRTKLAPALATPIVQLVRAYRASGEYEQSPTPRATIMIARMVVAQKLKPYADNKDFVQLCLDLLEGKCMRSGRASDCAPKHRKTLLNLIDKHCKPPRQSNGKARPMTPRKGTSRGGAARAGARRPVLVHSGGLNS